MSSRINKIHFTRFVQVVYIKHKLHTYIPQYGFECIVAPLDGRSEMKLRWYLASAHVAMSHRIDPSWWTD